METGTRKIGDSEDRSPQYLIVDGQQRLTSLYAVLTGQRVLTKTFEKKHIRIGFGPSDETFEVTDAAIEKDPEFIPDITALWTTVASERFGSSSSASTRSGTAD